MFEREKQVDLSMFGYDKPAIVKRLTAGEKRQMDNDISRANGMRVKGRDLVGELAPGELSLIYAKAYYKEGPFPKNEMENQDWEVISLIEDGGDELNSPLVVQKDNYSSPEPDSSSSTEVKPQTQ